MKETSPELIMRTILNSLNVDFRAQEPLLGTPDFFIPSRRLAIFVHGCFWHGHHCQQAHDKAIETEKRDISVIQRLKRDGLNVFIAWECDLRSQPTVIMNRLRRLLNSHPIVATA